VNDFQLSPGASGNAGWHFALLADEISTITAWWESELLVLGDYCGARPDPRSRPN
jgi:hypothetical protein